MKARIASFTLCSVLVAALAACHSQPAEPAPAPANYEIASAAPGARGARAAGTDAAPPIPSNDRELAEPDNGEDDNEDTDGGAAIDGGATTGAAPGVAL